MGKVCELVGYCGVVVVLVFEDDRDVMCVEGCSDVEIVVVSYYVDLFVQNFDCDL